MNLEVIKNKIDDNTEKLTYEDLVGFGQNNLQIFIDKYDGEVIDKLAEIVKDNDMKLFFKCAMKHYYLFDLLTSDELIKEDNLLKKVISLYPEIIKKFSDDLFNTYSQEILNALKNQPTLLEYCPIDFMKLNEKDIIMIVERQSKIIGWVPNEILIKYPKKIALFVKRRPELLKYISKDVQKVCIDELVSVILNDPIIFDYLDSELKNENLFKTCLLNLNLDLNEKQIALAFSLTIDNDNFLHDFSSWMIDDNLVEFIGIDKIKYLIKQKEVNEKLTLIYQEREKFECLSMMLSFYKDSPCLIEKILLLINALINDINFVEVRENDGVNNKKLADEVLIRNFSMVVTQNRDKLELVDIKRMIYLYLKKDGIICCDNFDDFKNLDNIRQQKMNDLLKDKYLTIKEAKNIIYEFNYGFSYTEVINLLKKYAYDLDKLLKSYNKKKLSLAELEEKQILFDLSKMLELSKIHDREVLKEEMNLALINYKGESKIYDRFLYFEEKLKSFYNRRTVNELNETIVYDNVCTLNYEDLVEANYRKKRYLGQKVLIKNVSIQNNFKMLLHVVDSNKNNLVKKYLMGVKEQLENQNENNIVCSLIGNNFFGLNSLYYKDGKRKVILRYSDLSLDSIITQALTDLNSSNRLNYLKIFNEEEYLLPNNVLDITRNISNGYVINLSSVNKQIKPISLVTFETIDSYLLEAAIDLNLPIEIIDRRQLVAKQIEQIECLFNKYMNYLNQKTMYYDTLETVKTAEEDCFGRLLKLFSSLRISLKNSDLRNELLKNNGFGLNEKSLMQYINSIFAEINGMISTNAEKSLNDLTKIKEEIQKEYEIVNKSNAFSKDKKILSFDLKNTYRQIDKLERKLGVNITNEKFKVKIFQDLNEGLGLYNKNYNRNWSFYGKQFDYEDVSSLIDHDKIDEALQLVYQNGLYRGKLSHDSSHIERCCIYASILANSLYPNDQEILNLSIMAAAFHDSGRIGERDEKHGDYSAAIVRSLLTDKDISKDNINIICASVDFHDEVSPFEELLPSFTKKYHLKDIIKYEKIAKILKDADALDRLRFIGVGTLDVKYLNFEISKNLIKLAALLNEKNAMNRLKCLISKFIIRKKYLDSELDSKRLPQEILYELVRENSRDLINDFFEDFKLIKDDIIILE